MLEEEIKQYPVISADFADVASFLCFWVFVQEEKVPSKLDNQQNRQESVSPQITPENKSPQLVLPVNKLVTPDNKSQQNLVVSPVEGLANGESEATPQKCFQEKMF